MPSALMECPDDEITHSLADLLRALPLAYSTIAAPNMLAYTHTDNPSVLVYQQTNTTRYLPTLRCLILQVHSQLPGQQERRAVA